jgi:hypothetical protein
MRSGSGTLHQGPESVPLATEVGGKGTEAQK